MKDLLNFFDKPKDPISVEAVSVKMASPDVIREWSFGEVRKPGSVPTICYRFVGDVHSSRPGVTARLERSTREQDGLPSPHLTLHPMGFTWPTLSPGPAVGSYSTVSTLPRNESCRASPSHSH